MSEIRAVGSRQRLLVERTAPGVLACTAAAVARHGEEALVAVTIANAALLRIALGDETGCLLDAMSRTLTGLAGASL